MLEIDLINQLQEIAFLLHQQNQDEQSTYITTDNGMMTDHPDRVSAHL